jgi:hypothetical protein
VAVDLGCCWMLFCTVEKGLLARALRMLWEGRGREGRGREGRGGGEASESPDKL